MIKFLSKELLRMHVTGIDSTIDIIITDCQFITLGVVDT
jgi:hypothetical protein